MMRKLSTGLWSEPLFADDGDHQVAGLQRVVDMLAEIDAERDVVDVDEEIRLAEMLGQPVEDAPRHGGVGPAIGHDDLRILPCGHRYSPSPLRQGGD